MATQRYFYKVKKLKIKCIGIVVSVLLLSSGFVISTIVTQSVEASAAASAASPAAVRLPESTDFATVTFGDGWDMTEFSDLSNYLNGAGRNPSLNSISVQNGLFNATSTVSTTDPDAYVFPLFPGLTGFMPLGNLGSVYPINPANYRCMFIAMKVDTTISNDEYTVLWYPDNTLAPPSTTSNSGMLFPLTLYPEFGTSRYWKLFMVDLGNPPKGYIGKAWSYSAWKGLEVVITHADNVPISIDWIRLTPSCSSAPQYSTSVTWTPSAGVTALWVRPQGTTRDIRVVNGINGLSGSYTLDTQGLAPGLYSVGLGTDTTCCSQWSTTEVEVNASPILDFNRPSPSSGEDYAASAGDAWDMNTSNDIDQILCSTWSFANSLLMFDTPYPNAAPTECLGPGVGEVDSRIFVNMPGTLSYGRDYRYLSYRMYQNGTISLPVDGMIVRWIWTTPEYCTRVSQGAAIDVGWHEYNIDLYNTYNGTPVEYFNCPVSPLQPWSQVGAIRSLRFDPNENWTGELSIVPPLTFHQEIDWIRLTKVDGVTRGAIFPIEITLNKDPSTLVYIDFYYTTSRSQPQQTYIGRSSPGGLLTPAQPPAQAETGQDADTAMATQFLYIPLLLRNPVSFPVLQPNQVRYLWDTSAVVPGEYYICGVSNDGLNQTTFCSMAPLQIRTP